MARTPTATAAQVPRLPWQSLRPRLQAEFRQGTHVTLIGPNGAGKTVLAAELAELRRYVLFLACKRKDPVIDTLRRRGYYVTGSLDQLPWTEQGPVHERVVYWPRFPERVELDERLRLQRARMRAALNFAEQTGNWCLIADEGIWMVQNLRLAKELEAIWFQGRTQGISLLFLAQRPAWVPKYAFSQATLIAIWQTNDRDDLQRLGDIAAGINTHHVQEIVSSLDWHSHEFLLINTRTRELAISVAPPPKGAPR